MLCCVVLCCVVLCCVVLCCVVLCCVVLCCVVLCCVVLCCVVLPATLPHSHVTLLHSATIAHFTLTQKFSGIKTIFGVACTEHLTLPEIVGRLFDAPEEQVCT